MKLNFKIFSIDKKFLSFWVSFSFFVIFPKVDPFDSGEAMWVAAESTLPDQELAHKKMKVGMRVSTFVSDRNDATLFIGTIQRVEPTRVRVKFDRHPISWRKVRSPFFFSFFFSFLSLGHMKLISFHFISFPFISFLFLC